MHSVPSASVAAKRATLGRHVFFLSTRPTASTHTADTADQSGAGSNGAFVEKTEKLEKLGKLFRKGRRGELFRSFSLSSNGHFSSFSRAFPVDERTIKKSGELESSAVGKTSELTLFGHRKEETNNSSPT